MSATIHTMDERRVRRRHLLNSRVDVRNCNTGETLGTIGNLHQEGLMLVGSKLNIHASYQIELLLPGHVFNTNSLALGIECLWCQTMSAEEQIFCCGCTIIDKSPFVESCIDTLIGIKSGTLKE